MENAMITMKNINKGYMLGEERLPILKDINFQVNKGEYVAILGPSGSGKTTLMNMIGCMDVMDSGEYYLDGMAIHKTKEDDLTMVRNQKIGFIFQNYQLIPTYNVMQNIIMPLLMRGMTHEEAEEKCKNTIKLLGLDHRIGHKPNELSGGQKQRVAIARVLANNPDILLCDEATSALDPQTTKSILELIRKINKEYGITVVVITHEMSVVQEICNRVAVLERGVLVESGTVEELFRSPKTEAARRLVFSGRAQIQKMNGKRLVRVTFKDKSSFEPVIANLVLTYRTPVNILYADTKNIGGAAEGEMILQLPEIEETAEKMIEYLRETNMGVEELSSDVG